MDIDNRYHLLVEFAHKHLDFQIAELASVLDMHGITLGGDDCRMEALPYYGHTIVETTGTTANTTHDSRLRPFLLLSLPFDSPWIPEEDRTAGATGTTTTTTTTTTSIAEMLSTRCTMVRNVMELWATGRTIEECAQSTQLWLQTKAGQRRFATVRDASWKLSIHTLGSTYTREEHGTMRAHFAFLPLQGPVQMQNPANEFVLIREVELDALGNPLYPRYSETKQLIAENDTRPPLACYFLRALCGGRKAKGRGIEQYSLKKRTYLGPTSMDAELSFIMTNLGQVRKGSIVLDPFVGTGSILLSCALQGAYCVGTDIDIRVLRGRSENENIWTNFRQFHLPRPDIIRSDNSIYHRHFRTNDCLYDAIICDPPYGIRAGARKSGSRLAQPKPVSEELRYNHIAQTRPYAVCDVMADLLDMAARTLVMGGRLVYVIPSYRDFDPECDLPCHECLSTVHICYQPLGVELGRRMVAMKKVQQYDPTKRTEYLSHAWKNGTESAEKCANIRDKIMENAKLKPGYEERYAHRKQKRKETRDAKRQQKRAVNGKAS